MLLVIIITIDMYMCLFSIISLAIHFYAGVRDVHACVCYVRRSR